MANLILDKAGTPENGIKNYWEGKHSANGRVNDYEVFEVDNGFIVRQTSYKEWRSDVESFNDERKSCIRIATTNPLKDTEPAIKKPEDELGLEGMIKSIAEMSGKFLVK